MNKRVKWTLLLLAAAALLILSGFELYRTIGGEEWQEERAAVEKAYAQTILYSTSKVVPYVGDRPYMVVFGKDKLKNDMLVWVSENDVHVEYAADGITAQEAEKKVTARDPDNRIIRTSAGKLFDDYVWEVYYKKKENGTDQYYYDYYRFSDGSFIDTFRLSLN